MLGERSPTEGSALALCLFSNFILYILIWRYYVPQGPMQTHLVLWHWFIVAWLLKPVLRGRIAEKNLS